MNPPHSPVEWSSEYSVGIPEIDEQHKALFELIAKIHTAIHERKGSAACQTVLDELVDYTRIHFALEQSLMRMMGYPDYKAHCEHHRKLVEDVEAMQAKIRAGSASISFELLHFLRNWLAKHIIGEDIQYARFFLSRKQAGFDTWVKRSEEAMEKRKKKWWKFW